MRIYLGGKQHKISSNFTLSTFMHFTKVCRSIFQFIEDNMKVEGPVPYEEIGKKGTITVFFIVIVLIGFIKNSSKLFIFPLTAIARQSKFDSYSRAVYSIAAYQAQITNNLNISTIYYRVTILQTGGLRKTEINCFQETIPTCGVGGIGPTTA